MKVNWNRITELYNQAANALWGPKENLTGWRRNKELGYFYLWQAYHYACESETKNNLTYARILMMIANEGRYVYTSYDRYNKFLRPAVEAYNKAKENGQTPTDKEYEKALRYANELKYYIKCENAKYEEQIKPIIGNELLTDFPFYDGQPIWFEHKINSARLKIQCGKSTATFLFEDIYEIKISNLDPTIQWVTEFYCYHDFYIPERIHFDIGSHSIVCTKVSVESVEKTE
jgi:hypothetical protein